MNFHSKKSIIEQVSYDIPLVCFKLGGEHGSHTPTDPWDSSLQEHIGLILGEAGGASKRYPDGTIIHYGDAKKGRE